MSKLLRSQEEINKQIEGLNSMKSWLPEKGVFGDNWAEIDAKIHVLKGGNPEKFWQDETAEEFEDGDNDAYHAAEQARQWIYGNEDNDLFEVQG